MKRFSLLFLLIVLIGTFTAVAQDIAPRAPISVDNAASVVQLGVIDAGTTGIASLAFSPNGKYIVSGDSDGVIKIWDLTNGEARSIESPGKSRVNAVVFSPDGAQIASSDGNNIILWDAETAEQVSVLEGHTDWVRSLAYNADGSILASGGDDKTIRLWDVATLKELHTIQMAGPVDRLAFTPDGKTLASTDGNTAGALLWDTATGEKIGELSQPETYYGCIVFNSDGTQLAAGNSYQNQIYIWDVETREMARTLEVPEGGTLDCAFSPREKVLASLVKNSSLRLWDTERGSGFSPLHGDSIAPYTIAVSADGTLIAVGSDDGFIEFWGTSDGGPLPLPTIPTAFTPQSGHWAGSTGTIEVSFDVNESGEVANFYFKWTVGMSYCTFDLSKEVPLKVEENKFTFGTDDQRFEGRFRSATVLFGTSPSPLVCGNSIMTMSSGRPTWWIKLEGTD